MRGVTTVVCLALALWLGSVLGGCWSAAKPCECPPMNEIAPAALSITESTRPELVGGTVEISAGKVVVRFGEQYVVFAGTPL